MKDMLAAVSGVISPVYLVGGGVRDAVMGRPCDDYDFATPLSPDAIEAAVRAAGKRAYLTGKRFGTIGFKVNGAKVEVTTFRAESYDAASRRPRVAFLDDIAEDLSYRDFTINAMAMDADGTLIDPFGGQQDLQRGLVRATGNARARLKEDPLRMLRAARFAAQLGFSVDSETVQAATRLSHRVLAVSHERWAAELDKLLLSERPSVGLRALVDMDVLRYVCPHLALQVGYNQNSPYHGLELWEHTLAVVDAVPADIVLRWAALLHDVGKPYARAEKPGRSIYAKHDLIGAELVLQIGGSLKWANAHTAAVSDLVRDHLRDESPLRAADNAAKGAQDAEDAEDAEDAIE